MPAVSPPDRVLMTVDGTTGDLTMTGAVEGYRTIQQAVADGDYVWGTETYWVAEDDGGNGTTQQAEWFTAVALENAPGDPVIVRTGGTLIGTTAGGTDRLEFAGSGLTRVFAAMPDRLSLGAHDLQANGGTVPETDRINSFDVEQTFSEDGEGFGGITSSPEGGLNLRGGTDGTRSDILEVTPDGIRTPGRTLKGPGWLDVEGVAVQGTDISLIRGFWTGYISSGASYGPFNTTGTSTFTSVAENRLHFAPFTFGETVSFSEISSEFDSGVSSSRSVRVGVYGNTGGKPGELVEDLGIMTIPAYEEEYAVSIPIDLTLPPGVYWGAISTPYELTGTFSMGFYTGLPLTLGGGEYTSTTLGITVVSRGVSWVSENVGDVVSNGLPSTSPAVGRFSRVPRIVFTV